MQTTKDEITIAIHVVSWVLGTIGALVSLSLALAAWIFRTHREDNNRTESEFREDIQRAHVRIDTILEMRKEDEHN